MPAWTLAWLTCFWAEAPATAPSTATRAVVPIDWRQLNADRPLSEATRTSARLLNTSLRYNLAWAERTHALSPDGTAYRFENMKEHAIRPPASVAFGLAIALQTGTYDAIATAIPADHARARLARLVRSVARAHPSTKDHPGWGDQWQSALWAALAGQAAWFAWNELDDECRRLAVSMVEFEADRFIRTGYTPPYWNGKGGDTKAEENAWNALVLQLAVAMMPEHPHAPAWRRICSELMISASATLGDWKTNETPVDGRPVRDWLKGYNLHDDYTLVNHNRIHTDYHVYISTPLWSYALLSLAGRPVPQAARFNADRVYRALQTREWPSPPHRRPGGTMYIPGRAEVYYPQGTDWSAYRFDIFYRLDTCIDVLGLDAGLTHQAAEWIPLRAERLLAMQARHEDGRLFAPGEYETYKGCEQMATLNFAQALLLNWLRDQDRMQPVGNWNQERGHE